MTAAASEAKGAPVALITGAAHRVGAAIARHLHGAGYRVLVHYRRSAQAARALARELDRLRPGSAGTLQGDLLCTAALPALVEEAVARWGRLDALVNNASSFYPTPLGSIEEGHWEDLMGTNLKAPLFLAQAAAPELRRRRGAIVNIVDIHAQRPLKGHPLYSVAKAGLAMLTRSLARELGPEVRVNGVAPGAILWPEQGLDEARRAEILERTTLKRRGEPADVARAVLFLLRDAPYVTGQILAVDGGRSLGH
ncbi:MAG: pteridine reductase [Gammaproteobacteria bacterium]|nr:MAG: pteridine reductase [Gammaproteobacteria bacterium]